MGFFFSVVWCIDHSFWHREYVIFCHSFLLFFKDKFRVKKCSCGILSSCVRHWTYPTIFIVYLLNCSGVINVSLSFGIAVQLSLHFYKLKRKVFSIAHLHIYIYFSVFSAVLQGSYASRMRFCKVCNIWTNMEWSTEHSPLAIFFWIERYSFRNKSGLVWFLVLPLAATK